MSESLIGSKTHVRVVWCPDCWGVGKLLMLLYVDTYYGRNYVRRCDRCKGHGITLRRVE